MFFEIKETNVETPLAGVFSRDAGIRAAHAPPRFFVDAHAPPRFFVDAHAPPRFFVDAYSPVAHAPPRFFVDAYSPVAHAPPRFFVDAYSPVAYSPAAFFRRRLFPRRLFHSPPSLKNLPLKGSPRTPPAPGSRSARSIGMSYKARSRSVTYRREFRDGRKANPRSARLHWGSRDRCRSSHSRRE